MTCAGRGERPAQVLADRREQRCPAAVGRGRLGGMPGQAAEQDQPPRARLSLERRPHARSSVRVVTDRLRLGFMTSSAAGADGSAVTVVMPALLAAAVLR